jgi:hypothetical protein
MMLGRWYVLGGVLLAMALGIVLTMLAPPYTLVKPSPHAPTGISCNYTLPIEQVNISVINYVRSYLHEKPLVWNQCLGTFAYLRYETVTDYWVSTGFFGHFFLTDNITSFFTSSPKIYEDMFGVPINYGVLMVVPHYVLNYTTAVVYVNNTVVGNTWIINVNGTSLVVYLNQLTTNETAQLALFLADPGHAYPLLDPNITYYGYYEAPITVPFSSCQWVSIYEEAYCSGVSPSTWIVGVMELGLS